LCMMFAQKVLVSSSPLIAFDVSRLIEARVFRVYDIGFGFSDWRFLILGPVYGTAGTFTKLAPAT